jgi:hypothetical protein
MSEALPEQQTDRAHRATFTVTVTSRPDGGHYLDTDDFSAHVAGWLKLGMQGRHAIGDVTVAPALTPCTCRQAVHASEHDGRTVPGCSWCAAAVANREEA